MRPWRDLYIPACCSPSAVPGGSGRKTIAEQAGAALPGALVAAAAERIAEASTNPIPTTSIVRILLFPPVAKLSAYTPASGPPESSVKKRGLGSGRGEFEPCRNHS